MKKKVLFVCLGNICRSPLAEAIFDHKTEGLGYESDSAGTAAYHIGKNPDPRSVEVAESHGIKIAHKARQFRVEDFEAFDWIMAMDQNNYDDMKSLTQGSTDNLFLLREFDPESDGMMDVPDPYYGGYDGFEKIYSTISRSIDHLLKHMNSKKS